MIALDSAIFGSASWAAVKWVCMASGKMIHAAGIENPGRVEGLLDPLGQLGKGIWKRLEDEHRCAQACGAADQRRMAGCGRDGAADDLRRAVLGGRYGHP